MITVSIIIKFPSVALTCAFLLSIVELIFFCRCQLHLKLHNSIQALFPALILNRVQLQKDVFCWISCCQHDGIHIHMQLKAYA